MHGSLSLLIEIMLIVVLPYMAWRFGGLNNVVPWVVIQILAGIAMGPSGLGRVAPALFGTLFEPANLEALSGIAAIGLLLFVFITGLHCSVADDDELRPFALLSVGAGSIVVPCGLGFAAGLWIYRLAAAQAPMPVGETEFAFAISIALGITALPVMAAILRELNLLGIELGRFALRLAVINDATLWILLTFLLAQRQFHSTQSAYGVLAGLSAYLLVMFLGVRPILRRLFAGARSQTALSDGGLLWVFGLVALSASITELLGLHYLLGAFIAGACMPPVLRPAILARIEAATSMLLLPFFFVLTGLRTVIDLQSDLFVQTFLIATTAAVAGKMIGTIAPARWAGYGWRASFALGALMQTKGLMELVVLTILRDAGLIGPDLFAALIAMALAATGAAKPLLWLATPKPEPALASSLSARLRALDGANR